MASAKKAVFLDRDGVLIHDVHYLSDINQIVIYEDVPKGLLSLQKMGYLLIVVTNQSGIARGYFTEEFVIRTHRHLAKLLAAKGVLLNGFFYCPHHVDGKKPYNLACDCRKPAPGMIIQAARENNIDCHSSFMIGDKVSDMELAVNSGTKGLFVTTGKGEVEVAKLQKTLPQIPVFNSFSEAVGHILQSDSES